VKDNSDGTYACTYPGATKAGVYTITPKVTGQPVQKAPFKVKVSPGEVDPRNFQWEGLELDAEGRRVVVAGTTDKFAVIAKDAFGNRLEKGGLNVKGKVTGPGPVDVATKDNNDGSYQLIYTPTKTGQYQFAVNLDATAVGGHNNPFPLVVIPAKAGGNSLAYGPGLEAGTVGAENPFTVETRDAFDNKLTQGGSDVKVDMVNDATGERVPVQVKDNGDGTYSCAYPGVTKAGSYTITPKVNGEAVKKAPFKVNVAPGGFDLSKTGVEIPNPGFTGRKGPKITVRDTQGNPRSGFDDDVEADLTPKMKIPKVKAKNNGDGTYDIEYPSNLLPGAYEIDIRVNGQNAPKSPFQGDVKKTPLSSEHQTRVAGNVLLAKALLELTEAERDQLLQSLGK